MISTPQSPRLARQLPRSHDIARISHIHRLSILRFIRLSLHVHHAQIVHPLRLLIARGRITIARQRPEDLIHALCFVWLLRTAIVRRQVEAHVAYVGWSGRGPDPGSVLHSWVREHVTYCWDGLFGAGVEVDVGVGVVGEALDTVRSGALRINDRDVAGVSDRIW